MHGSDVYGNPNTEIPADVLESITRNGVRSMLHASAASMPPHDCCHHNAFGMQCG